MPSTYAHYYFGHEVMKNLSPGVREIIRENKKVFDIGLHGPDIFFYYEPFIKNKVMMMGHEMHRRNVTAFIEKSVVRIGRMKDKRAAVAYMAGFICHFALDSECHGFVDRWVELSGVSHTEIEMEFDKALLRDRGIDPMKYRFGWHLSDKVSDTAVIDRLYPVSHGVVRHAVASMKFCLWILSIKNEIFRKIEFAFLRITGQYQFIRGMIINRRDNPKCFKSTEILENKLRKAVPTAVILIDNYMDYLYGGGVLSERFDRNFK